MSNKQPILVVGATGMQGGAVVNALLQQGSKVRALCRSEAKGSALAERGVEIAIGDLDDVNSLVKAMEGARGVFSVQLAPAPQDGDDSELRAGRNLVEAARKAGIEQVVHTSVARAGDEKNFKGWDEGRWWKAYWEQKSGVNDAIKAAGFKHWTIVKPAFIFEDFLPKSANLMFPALAKGSLTTAMQPDTKVDMIAVKDVAAFAAAAFADAVKFDRQEIDLASEALTMQEIATILANVTQKPVKAEFLSYDQMVASGVYPLVAQSQLWDVEEGYQVNIPRAKSFGLPLQSFADWAQLNKDGIEIGE